jgi:hypothetical protein
MRYLPCTGYRVVEVFFVTFRYWETDTSTVRVSSMEKREIVLYWLFEYKFIALEYMVQVQVQISSEYLLFVQLVSTFTSTGTSTCTVLYKYTLSCKMVLVVLVKGLRFSSDLEQSIYISVSIDSTNKRSTDSES